MAIYLDEQTRPYLERLIKKAVEISDKDFVAKRLQGMLQSDKERLENIASCEHSFGEYIGQQQMCTKCLTHNVGMGTSWTFKKKLSKKEIEKLRSSVEIQETARTGSLFDK